MNKLRSGHGHQGRKRIALGLLLLLGLAEFSIRGPIRASRQANFNDFLSPYVQTNAWLRDQDPYDPQVVAQLWPAGANPPLFLLAESRNGTLPAKRGIPSPYPLTAFPLLVPLAALRWPIAIMLWNVFNMIVFAAIVFCVVALARIPLRSTEAVLIVLSALVLAPFHTAIAASNVVLLVFALGMLVFLSLERHRYIWAGILLAAAAALKPTVALCFFIYPVARGRWKVATIALAGVAVLFAIADLRMIFAGVHWASSYLLNTQRMFTSGAIDDYTPANRTRFDLLNLQLVIFQVVGSKARAEILSWLVVCGFWARWALSWRRQETHNDPLFDLAILATIGLLPFYHRFTDGGLLFPAVAWAITEFNKSRRLFARAILIFAAPFVLPGAAILQVLATTNSRVVDLARSWWWQFLLAPHQVWMILAISVVLLAAQWKLIRTSGQGSRERLESVAARQ